MRWTSMQKKTMFHRLPYDVLSLVSVYGGLNVNGRMRRVCGGWYRALRPGGLVVVRLRDAMTTGAHRRPPGDAVEHLVMCECHDADATRPYCIVYKHSVGVGVQYWRGCDPRAVCCVLRPVDVIGTPNASTSVFPSAARFRPMRERRIPLAPDDLM